MATTVSVSPQSFAQNGVSEMCSCMQVKIRVNGGKCKCGMLVLMLRNWPGFYKNHIWSAAGFS
jgi:hypothetical protein